MNLRTHYYLAILAASCALGQQVAVGLVFQFNDPSGGSYLVPAGTYSGGKWVSPGDGRPARTWTLSGDGRAAAPIHIIRDCDGDRYCWIVDMPKRTSNDGRPTLIGMAVSPVANVTVFRGQAADSSKILLLLQDVVKKSLDSKITGSGIHPSKPVTLDPPRILRSEAAIAGFTYYHVRYQAEVYNAANPCGSERFIFEAWISESSGSAPRLITSNSMLGECEGSGLTYLDPAGILTINNEAFVVAEEFYYEGASTVIEKLDPHSLVKIVSNHWTQD